MVSYKNFIAVEDFDSNFQNWGYIILDQTGVEDASWQYYHSLVLVNTEIDIPNFYSRTWHFTLTSDIIQDKEIKRWSQALTNVSAKLQKKPFPEDLRNYESYWSSALQKVRRQWGKPERK